MAKPTLKQYIVVTGFHVGTLKVDLKKGEIFESDGKTYMEYEGKGHTVQSLAGAVREGWLRELTPEEVEAMSEDVEEEDEGEYEGAPFKADDLLEQRLKDSEMVKSDGNMARTSKEISDLQRDDDVGHSILPADKSPFPARRNNQQTGIGAAI